MLPAGRQVIDVYNSGVLQAASPGTLFIDSSTIDVTSAHAAHRLANAAGMLSLDAPVSGGVGGAEAATLTFMAGGTAAAFERAKPILESHGPARCPLRRCGCRPGCQDLQQHDAGHQHDRRQRSVHARGKAWPVAQGAVRSGVRLVRPILGADQLLPRSRLGAERALQQQLQARLCQRPHAEGPEAGAGGGRDRRAPLRRWARRPHNCSGCTMLGARAARISPALFTSSAAKADNSDAALRVRCLRYAL